MKPSTILILFFPRIAPFVENKQTKTGHLKDMELISEWFHAPFAPVAVLMQQTLYVLNFSEGT